MEPEPWLTPALDAPMLTGNGPAWWSTCADLAIDPIIINDTNMYYRILGFRWPFRGITKRMLRRAYRKRGGPDNVAMTTALKTLLNADMRRLYDRRRLGSPIIDEHMWNWILREATKQSVGSILRGEPITREELMEEWGVAQREPSTYIEPNEPVDAPEKPLSDETPNDEAESDPPVTVPPTWPWGYYRWRSSCEDEDRLERWQTLLRAEAFRVGLRVHLAVGFAGRTPSRTVECNLAGLRVIFLNEGVDPDEGLAGIAVDQLRNDPKMINPDENVR